MARGCSLLKNDRPVLLAESPGSEAFYEFAVFDLRLDGHTMEDFTEGAHEPQSADARNPFRAITSLRQRRLCPRL